MPDRTAALPKDRHAGNHHAGQTALMGDIARLPRSADDGATADTLAHDWKPGAVDLLVVGSLDDGSVALKLCRTLAFQSSRLDDTRRKPCLMGSLENRCQGSPAWPDTPILFLISPEQRELGDFALECGAHRCLVRPLCIKNVTDMLARIGSKFEWPSWSVARTLVAD